MINSYFVQFQGSFEVGEPLDKEKYALVMGEFDFGDVVDKPTGEGSDDRYYKLLPTRVEVKQGDTRLFGKPKRRESQRLRGCAWHHYQTIKDPQIDFDSYYANFINKLIIQFEEVKDFLGDL